MPSRALRRPVKETQRDGEAGRFHRQSESHRPRSREWQGQTVWTRPEGRPCSFRAQQARWIRGWTDSTVSPPSEEKGIQTSCPDSVYTVDTAGRAPLLVPGAASALDSRVDRLHCIAAFRRKRDSDLMSGQCIQPSISVHSRDTKAKCPLI